MGEWGDWTEWTRMECGEQLSGAALPVRGQYQEHIAEREGPVSTMQEGRFQCLSGIITYGHI